MLKVDDFLFVITGDPSQDQDEKSYSWKFYMRRALIKCISVNLHDRKPTNFTKYLESKQVAYGFGGFMFLNRALSSSIESAEQWKDVGKKSSKNSPAELLLGIGLLDMENLHTHSMVSNFMQRFQGVSPAVCCLMFHRMEVPFFLPTSLIEVKFVFSQEGL